MALSCTKDFTCTVGSPATTDMPLDAAIYHSTNDAIYAVRGGYLFKLNASTGALVTSNRFAQISFPTTNLVWDETNDKLWASIWHDRGITSYSGTRNRRLYDLNPTDLSKTADYNMQSYCDVNYTDYSMGPGPLLWANNTLYIGTYDTGGRQVDSYDPSNIPVGSSCGLITNLEAYGTDLCWDSDASDVWAADSNASEIASISSGSWSVTGGLYPSGVCYCPDNTRVYVATGTQYVDAIRTSDGNITALDMSRANARPLNIKYNPNDQKVYVPNYHDDTVVVIDPNDGNSMVVKTGFDLPWDVVFTPTKQWAVQHGNVGLLEIT